MAVFRGNSPFPLKASPIAPQSVSPNHFAPPMPAKSLSGGETGTSLKFFWTQLCLFLHQISNKYWVNCQEWNCWRGLENVVAECQKIWNSMWCSTYSLKYWSFFFWRGRSRIGARLFQWLCSIFLNFCVLWYRNPSLMGQQNITRSTETQELLVFIISWKYCLGQTWKLELDRTLIQ